MRENYHVVLNLIGNYPCLRFAINAVKKSCSKTQQFHTNVVEIQKDENSIANESPITRYYSVFIHAFYAWKRSCQLVCR